MLDTNVLISGMVFQGPERRLLETILKNAVKTKFKRTLPG